MFEHLIGVKLYEPEPFHEFVERINMQPPQFEVTKETNEAFNNLIGFRLPENEPFHAMSMNEIIAMQKENAELKAENMLIKYKLDLITKVVFTKGENEL
jgi:hypothetical protein